MEAFDGVYFVRLRCSVPPIEYLAVDEDGRGIRLSGRRVSPTTVWGVDPVMEGYGESAVLLRGAYGRYLLATSFPATTGPPRAVTAMQANFLDEIPQPEMLWQVARRGEDFLLRNRVGGLLRASGKDMRHVTVAEDDGSAMLQWQVEVVPPRVRRPSLMDMLMANPSENAKQGNREVTRQIRYVRAASSGSIDEDAWSTMELTTNSLQVTFAKLMEQERGALHTTLCIQGGHYGQLTPLLIDLPLNNDRIDLVMLTHNTRVENELLYPDFDAESVMVAVSGAKEISSFSEVPGSNTSSEEVEGMLNECVKRTSFWNLSADIVHIIAVNLPTLADILRLAFTSKWLHKILTSWDFMDAYYRRRGRSLRPLVAMIDRQRVNTAAIANMEAIPLSFDAILGRLRFRVIDCRVGLVLLRDESKGEMIVSNPVRGTAVNLPPLKAPMFHIFLAAGLVPTSSGHNMVMALFAPSTKSCIGRETAWVATCHLLPGLVNWNGFSHHITFSLPRQIRGPSVVAGSNWHVLAFNDCIISVSLDDNHAVARIVLPFEPRVDRIPGHIIGKTRSGELSVLSRQDGILTVWVISAEGDIGNWINRRTHLVGDLTLVAFAEENCLVINNHFIAFNPETGEVSLPLQIPNEEQDGTDVTALEMPWPPRPIFLSSGDIE